MVFELHLFSRQTSKNGGGDCSPEEPHQPPPGDPAAVEVPPARVPRGAGQLPAVWNRGLAHFGRGDVHILRYGQDQEDQQGQRSAGGAQFCHTAEATLAGTATTAGRSSLQSVWCFIVSTLRL